MPDRVLNFLEFSDKYSNGTNEPISIDDITNASDNFKEGFDEETYDQPQIKPNRPISGNYEMTPAIPGEEGAPSFSEENTSTMDAPEDDEKPVESEEEDEEAEEGNPEAGANPKKKVEEHVISIKGFSEFINEELEYGSSLSEEEEECPECGEVPISNEYGSSCACTM